VLLDAQCMQHRLRELAPNGTLADPWPIFPALLDISLDNFDCLGGAPDHERASVTPTAVYAPTANPSAGSISASARWPIPGALDAFVRWLVETSG
jgi:hypothetical protein